MDISVLVVCSDALGTLPDIKLDRAGTLTGVVTDKATGQPISFASVLVSSMHGRRGSGAPGVQAGFDGRYTFSGLGPYDWTLFISAFGHGSQFTGGGANRFLADGAEVNAGQTTTYDIKMSKGTTVTVNVTGPDGEPAPGTDVVFVNAFTGDEMGRAVPDVDPPHTLQVTGPQLVKLRVEGSSEFWVGGSDFIHARLYLIPGSGSRTIDVPVP